MCNSVAFGIFLWRYLYTCNHHYDFKNILIASKRNFIPASHHYPSDSPHLLSQATTNLFPLFLACPSGYFIWIESWYVIFCKWLFSLAWYFQSSSMVLCMTYFYGWGIFQHPWAWHFLFSHLPNNGQLDCPPQPIITLLWIFTHYEIWCGDIFSSPG